MIPKHASESYLKQVKEDLVGMSYSDLKCLGEKIASGSVDGVQLMDTHDKYGRVTVAVMITEIGVWRKRLCVELGLKTELDESNLPVAHAYFERVME